MGGGIESMAITEAFGGEFFETFCYSLHTFGIQYDYVVLDLFKSQLWNHSQRIRFILKLLCLNN